MSQFRPMLAAAVQDVADLKFPLLASPKLDGIRAIVRDGVVVSRSLKPIPNKFVQAELGHARFNGLDGELIVGSAMEGTTFNSTTRGVMTSKGEPDFHFHVFDDCSDPDLAFEDRLRMASAKVKALGGRLVEVPHTLVRSPEEVLAEERKALELGYEGLMLRRLTGPYKYGRSTLKALDLLKLKQFEDAEADVIGFEELMHNANEATTSALGLTERSHHQDNLIGMGTLGALVVRGRDGSAFPGVEFRIGTGFNAAQRLEIWQNRGAHLCLVVKYKFFPGGSKDAPRFPVFLGWRNEIDM